MLMNLLSTCYNIKDDDDVDNDELPDTDSDSSTCTKNYTNWWLWSDAGT